MADIYGTELPDNSKKIKTALAKNFTVTDDHRKYCTDKWNQPYLADVFLDEFIECFELNGRKHFDWDLTFKNYIRNSGPGGRFYNHIYWQTKCEQARRMEYPDRKRAAQPYHPQEVAPRTDPVMAHEACSKLLKLLRA